MHCRLPEKARKLFNTIHDLKTFVILDKPKNPDRASLSESMNEEDPPQESPCYTADYWVFRRVNG